jgi:hypothetical protein
MKKAPPGEVVNPFSDKFIETWHLWKEYKKETFGFVYKGVFSEQMTLKKLCELSDGDEEKAVRIIEQSIMRQWQGIFPLHIPSNNGKSKQQSTTNNGQENSIRESVQAEFNRRYAGGRQANDGAGLKAV